MHAASGRILSVLVWVVLTPPVLRALGPEGFAVWSLFYALTGYYSAFDFGLAQGTLRAVAAARERGDERTGGAFATLAVVGYLALGLLWLALTLLFRDGVLAWLRVPDGARGAAGFAFAAGSAVFLLAGIANVFMAVLQGHGRFDLANRVLVAAAAQQAVGIPLILWRGWGLQGLVINVGVGWALGAAIGAWSLRRAAPEFRFGSLGASLPHLREALRFGGPLQAAAMLNVFHAHLDKFLIPRFVALAAVTPYELGFRVLSAAVAFPLLLQVTILPAAAALHAADNPNRLRELYQRGNCYMLTASAVTVAVLFASADRIYSVWLGPGHEEAALVLRWLSVTSAVTFAVAMATTVARGIGRTDLELWLGATAAVLHLGLSLWLLPRFGLPGALIAIFSAHLVGCAVFMWFLGGVLGWSRWRLMLEPLGRPLMVMAIGIAAGMLIDRVAPQGKGFLAWVTLAGVAGVAGAAAASAAFVTRLLDWRELRSLVFDPRGGEL
jgi:O-antigen/teichoic acid export membrane protein